MDIGTIAIYIISIIAIFIIGRIFYIPIKWSLKLLFNSIIGAIILYLINIVGAFWKLHIGINFITAIVVGILGIPGVILLILFSIIF